MLPDLQLWHLPGAYRRCFHVDGGLSRTFSSGTSRGGRRRRFHVDGGCSRTFSPDTSWGSAIDVFTSMVGALGPSAPTPTRGPCGRSGTFSSDTSRGPAVDIFMMMVGAPGPSAPTPLGAHRRYFHVDGGLSRTFSSGISCGPTINCRVKKIKITERGAENLAPPTGSQPLLR
jgi:hypothetical protein